MSNQKIAAVRRKFSKLHNTLSAGITEVREARARNISLIKAKEQENLDLDAEIAEGEKLASLLQPFADQVEGRAQ